MATPLALIFELIATDSASEVFKKVGAEAGVASKETSGLGSAFTKMGGIVALAGAGMAVVALKMAVDMQESTAKIQGNAQITQKTAVAIGDAFLATAGKSTFSGKAMADAFGPVAGVVQTLAGHTLTAADAMTVMNAATTLAEATGQPLEVTTANLAAVMQNYGLKLKDAEEASNILFNTSRLTNVGLDTLTTTVDKLHGKLGIAAPTLTDVSALMVDLANHGVSGSKGLMVVNSGLTTLMGGSKSTTAELKTLGVHVFDTSGKFVGMKGVLEQLTPKLKDMTEQQRLAAEKALFGAGAARALDSTIRAGATGLEAATKAVAKHGAAETAAKAASETLGGQMKTLRSAFADIVTMIGEKMIPVVTRIVTWFEKHSTVTKVLAAVIGGVLTVAVVLWTASMVAAGIATLVATSPVLLIIIAIAGLAAGLIYAYQHSETFRDVVNGAFHAVQVVIGKVVQVIITIFRGMLNTWTTVIGGIINAAANIAEALHLPFAKGLRAISDGFNATAKAADDKLREIAHSAGEWGQQAGVKLASGLAGQNRNVQAAAAGLAVGVYNKMNSNLDTYSIGVAASQGLARGIAQDRGGAVAAAQRLGGEVAKSLRLALQVHSPSKVTMEIGRYVGLGLAQGMDSQRGTVAKSAAAMLVLPRVGSLDFASSAGRSSVLGGGSGHDDSGVVAAIRDLGDRFAVELNNQARTIQTMQRQMAGA